MFKLRDYQQAAHEATIAHCRKTNDPAIHDQSVGAGKTIEIAVDVKHVIDKGGRALVLARQGDLINQNSNCYFKIGGKCSVFSESLKKKSTYYPAIFGTEGSVCRALNYQFKDLKFDFIAIDECHEFPIEKIDDCINAAKKGGDIYSSVDESGKKLYPQYAIIIAHFMIKNPKVRIIGYSGSAIRGNKEIIGDFWKAKLSEVGTYELISKGYLVPPVFGWGGDEDHLYNLGKFKPSDNELASDFSSKEMAAMQRAILKDESKTSSIISEVIERTRDRLGVLITCAGKAHCKQVAKYLPVGTWAIVTDEVSTTKRTEILNMARKGEIKYVLQVNCLGQGVDVPRWCTLVILRKIGSLRYLIQLTGRVLRLLPDEEKLEHENKINGLVLDYTDTFESMGDIFDHPITDMALAAKSKFDGATIPCPKCNTPNSQYAVRCIGSDLQSDDDRCEHFFKSSMCFNCMTENAPTARNCRKCEAVLIDPNKALRNKAYTDADYKPVLSMTFEATKTNALRVVYALDSTYEKQGIKHQEFAKELLHPFDKDRYKKELWRKFINDHIQGNNFRRSIMRTRTLDGIMKAYAVFDQPIDITHRVNEKGFSIINRKKFRSGRESLTG